MGITFGNTNKKNNNNSNSPFVSPIYTPYLAGNITVYTPSQNKNREKYFNRIKYKGKNIDLAGNRQLSIHFPLISPIFSIFRRKKYGRSPTEMEKWCFFPGGHNKFQYRQKIKGFSIIGKFL